jgi:hypothetical protein
VNLQLVTIFEVIVHPDDDKQRAVYRVPAPHLRSFLEGLTFSNVPDFRVIREDTQVIAEVTKRVDVASCGDPD